MIGRLTFRTLQFAMHQRIPFFRNKRGELAHSKPDGSDWPLSKWSNAAFGELGEAANVIKKIERDDFTLSEARAELAKEIADGFCYYAELATQAGISLDLAIAGKFNEVSRKQGISIFIDPEDRIVNSADGVFFND